MTDRVRAKFRCVSELRIAGSSAIEYKFNACGSGSAENTSFHRFTPSGSLAIMVDNPAIEGFYQIGAEYYLDFTRADPAA